MKKGFNNLLYMLEKSWIFYPNPLSILCFYLTRSFSVQIILTTLHLPRLIILINLNLPIKYGLRNSLSRSNVSYAVLFSSQDCRFIFWKLHCYYRCPIRIMSLWNLNTLFWSKVIRLQTFTLLYKIGHGFPINFFVIISIT